MPDNDLHSLPVRILFVITDLDVGGAEKALTELAVRLDRSRWEPHVCCLIPAGAMARVLESHEIPVHSLNMRSSWSAPWKVFALRRLVRKLKPEIVHTFLFHASLIGRLASALNKVSIVVSSIRVAERRFRHHLWLDRWTSAIADRIVCVSTGVAAHSRDEARLPGAKISVIPNGIDISEMRTTENLDREEFDLTDQQFVFLFVGRLDQQKGVDVLLRAFRLVVNRDRNTVLLLVGTGPDESRLREQVQQLDIGSFIRFAGHRSDVAAIMSLADAFVLPSRWEGMPNVVLESMAVGVPVLATRTEGTVDLIRDDVTGRLVDIDDVEGLANSMCEFIDSRDQIAEYARNAQQLVQSQYSIESVVGEHERLYLDLLEAKRCKPDQPHRAR